MLSFNINNDRVKELRELAQATARKHQAVLSTESAMGDLIVWYNETLPAHPWTVAAATEFVFRFLSMHPFNGRRRTERLM